MSIAYNLSEFANRLRTGGKHWPVVGAIDRWTHYNSRLADLKHAQDLLKLLDTAGRQFSAGPALMAGETPIGDLQGALLAQAILLYVRATGDGNRGQKHAFDVTKAYSEEQRTTHDHLVDLRKTAIAHFDEEARQAWHRDGTLLVVRDDGFWEYGFSYSRTTYQAMLFAALVALLAVAVEYVNELVAAENPALHAMLEAALTAEPELKTILYGCEFQVAKFYGASAAAERIHQVIYERGGDHVWNVPFLPE